jgi:hypothetical protein
MAYATHTFVSSKPDGSHADMLQPSSWNAEQPITLEANENFVTDAEKAALGNLKYGSLYGGVSESEPKRHEYKWQNDDDEEVMMMVAAAFIQMRCNNGNT